eukprot:TRINITY_DN14831_c0_g1_i2.p1 TRINITY_DN14831_c0_g1~~TRINITY_DN14831_c0_g1_i2.p1  ORF type:complete len:296 (+),score=66.53 TRINITY_DN14831_c0_g1_i2:185-1072(+)
MVCLLSLPLLVLFSFPFLWRSVHGIGGIMAAMAEARITALANDGELLRSLPEMGSDGTIRRLKALSRPGRSDPYHGPVPPSVEGLMQEPRFTGFWNRLSRAPASEFNANARRCWDAASAMRQAASQPRLPVPLTMLARHARVEPFDCLQCAVSTCELCGGIAQSTDDKCCHVLLGDVLRETAAWLNRQGITWFLFAGTLLGAIRDQGIIRWTNDLDIAIWEPDLDRLRELDPELEKRGNIRYFIDHDTLPHMPPIGEVCVCLLYTSDAADEEDSVDLGGRRIIKQKKKQQSKIEG